MSTDTRRRFTIEEDKLLLADWWDPARRERLAAQLGRSVGSMSFRYYSLLRKMGVDPGAYRSAMRLKELASGLPGPVGVPALQEAAGGPYSSDVRTLSLVPRGQIDAPCSETHTHGGSGQRAEGGGVAGDC